MTTITTINDLLTRLKTASSTYQTQATALVKKADSDLSALRTPSPDSADYALNADWGVPSGGVTQLTLDQISSLSLPGSASLQEIDQTIDSFAPTVFSMNLPAIPLLAALPVPEMSDGAVSPQIAPLTINPDVPTLNEPSSPSLTSPRRVMAEPISGDAPDVPLPSFTVFSGDVHSEYLTGLGLIGGDFTDWSAWLAQLRSQLLPIETQLLTRLRNALDGTEPGLADTWESQTYQQEQQVVFGERHDALMALETSSITGLPSGDSVYQQLQIELKTLQAVTQAAAKTTNARQDREVEHLKWAINLLVGMANAAIEIKAQEALWRMKGWELALQGAEVTLDTVLKVVAFKERELEFLVRYNDTQVRRLEIQVEMEKTKLESVQLEIENNRLLLGHNAHEVQAYQIAGQVIENRLRLYQGQIEYLSVDVAWRKLAIQAFEAEINAYQTRARAKSAEYQMLKAKINRDEKQIESELARVQLYEAQVASETVQVQSMVNKVNAQMAYRGSLLKQHNASLQANTAYLNAFDDYTQTVLDGLDRQFSLESTEKELRLADKELTNQAALEQAERTLEYEALELVNRLKNHDVSLRQAKAESEVLSKGADVLGGISTTAFSGLNAIAITEFQESM
jgi:hypothetical protein